MGGGLIGKGNIGHKEFRWAFLLVHRQAPWVEKNTKVFFLRTWSFTCFSFPGGKLMGTLEESSVITCKAKQILGEAKGW